MGLVNTVVSKPQVKSPMKIIEVSASQPLGTGSPPDWRTSMGQILVTVQTDAGLSGHGVGGGGAAGIHVIHAILRELLVGRAPEPVEQLWQQMYDATLPFGRKGLAIMALSGVDLALWDLRGKAAGKSVAELLGGVRHRTIPTYVTVWDDIPDAFIGKHDAFKIHVGKADSVTPDSIERLVAAARAKVGPDAMLMLDAWMKWTVPLTLDVARRIERYNVGWIEEPLSPDDLAGYETLVRDCPVPIAGGEHEFTAAAFRELIECRLHHVLQPDVCWCGGMTELVKIYRLAQERGLRVCPHRGGEPWGLHAIAALDDQPLAESGRPWLTWMEPTGADILTQPGFGVAPNLALTES
jgi:L-alanine-DL-glutamate epimerase-like enolase superfamily enzyme